MAISAKLSVRQAATKFRLFPSQIYTLIAATRVHGDQDENGIWRVDEASLVAYLDARKRKRKVPKPA